MKEYLTDLEIEKIEAFCTDTAMYEAVKKILLADIYYRGAFRKGEKLEARNQAFNLLAVAHRDGSDISNETLGQELRSQFEGINSVEQAFGYLKTVKKEKGDSVESPYNEAI